LFSATTDNALYTVAYGDYAPSVRFNVDDELAANRDNFLKRVDASLKTTKPLTMDGRKGLSLPAKTLKPLSRVGFSSSELAFTKSQWPF
jgi:hypothetical protein